MEELLKKSIVIFIIIIIAIIFFNHNGFKLNNMDNNYISETSEEDDYDNEIESTNTTNSKTDDNKSLDKDIINNNKTAPKDNNSKTNKNADKNTKNSKTNKKNDKDNNSASNNNNNSNTDNKTIQSKTIRERIQSAYSKSGSSLSNFKNQLSIEFGGEGVGFKVTEIGNTWMIEIINDNYIEVMNSNGAIENYLIPERDCGAAGDGSTDDTSAIRNCLVSDVKNIVLKGTYLITSTIETNKEKNIFKGNFINQIQNGSRAFAFRNVVRMNGTSLTSNIRRTGTSPHGEIFNNTSNIDFVEVWGNEGIFINCNFTNALRGIRGRKSTGSTIVPQNLYVYNTHFIDNKAPIQGYFANTEVYNSYFKNNGDLYSGDHAIYLEASSTRTLTVTNSIVETYGTESGAAFQTYGKSSNQITPKINILNTNINANGIVSSDLADVTLNNINFTSQHYNRNAITVENGSVLIENSKINHNLFISKHPNTPIIARNTEFKLNKVSGASRAFFPTECSNCTFINWGGYVLYPTTRITNSIFTRDTDHVVGNYYIGVSDGSSIYIEGSKFKASDNIAYNSSGTLSIKNSYFTNNIGINVPNVILEGNISQDITN